MKKELELKMIALKSNIDALKLQIKDLNSQKELIETNKENIRYNNEIEGKLRVVEANIKTENGTRDTILRTIEKAKSVIQHYENEIAKREEIVKTLSEEEKIIRNWAIYQEMVGKNGIIKIVLRRALPILNNEIARLLNGLCDFNVEISVSDDNKVCMDLLRNGQRLDLVLLVLKLLWLLLRLDMRCLALRHLQSQTSLFMMRFLTVLPFRIMKT